MIPPSMLAGYDDAKRRLSEIAVMDGPRYHALRAICFATEAALDIEANRRFYVPGAITAIIEKRECTSWVKCPLHGHRKFSEWIDPIGDGPSFVREVFDLAVDLADRRTVLDVCPQDVRNMCDYVKIAVKVIRKHIPVPDLIFLKHHLVSVCDYCESVASPVFALSDPARQLNETVLYANAFKRILSAGADLIEDGLARIARRQKNAMRSGTLVRESDADKDAQWQMFLDLEKEYPSVSMRERIVLKRTAKLKCGYKRGGLRRRWCRWTKAGH